MILSKESERESQGVAGYIRALTAKVLTALVSCAGKANCREAEQYIRVFRLWTSSVAYGLTVEIYAVNGRFPFDFLQTFSSRAFENEFRKKPEGNRIVYIFQNVNELELPNIKLPRTE